jgi:hypothetical protein
MRYELHPACAVWPDMQPEALQELADDIALNGLHEPLTLAPDGRLLDGRNRALACELVGVEPSTVVYDGDPALFSLSKNKHRRHMTQDQIALVAATLATRPLGANQYEGGSNELPSIAEAAAAVGVPETAVKSAKTVLRDGSPEEIEAVKTGKAKLRATADALRARKKPQPAPTAPRPSAAPDRVRAAEVATLEKELWAARDKLDQLSMFLVAEPQPKAEDRPVAPRRRYWPVPETLERRPKDVAPRQIVEPTADLISDPTFALRREEFEQWLVRRKEALEHQFKAREDELAKSFEIRVKARIKTAVERRMQKERLYFSPLTEAQLKTLLIVLHPDTRDKATTAQKDHAATILLHARSRLVFKDRDKGSTYIQPEPDGEVQDAQQVIAGRDRR